MMKNTRLAVLNCTKTPFALLREDIAKKMSLFGGVRDLPIQGWEGKTVNGEKDDAYFLKEQIRKIYDNSDFPSKGKHLIVIDEADRCAKIVAKHLRNDGRNCVDINKMNNSRFFTT